MSANNLRRDEARERAKLLDVASYTVSLDLAGGGETFRSRTLVRFTCREEEASSFLELTAPTVLSVGHCCVGRTGARAG